MAEEPDTLDQNSSPQDSPPAARPRRRFGAAPIALGFAAVLGVVALTIVIVSYAGSASDGDPVVALKLGNYPQAGDSGSGPKHATFVGVRSLNGNLVADPALLEDSAEGPLPIMARDGRAPFMAYARPFAANDKRPRIAVLIGGLGVGAKDTGQALMLLPPAITLGFAPFAQGVQDSVDKARSAGHEVLIEVPMEPFDFPDSDPGPHSLMAAATSDENIKRLNWTLSRFTGYAGVTNLLGGRFLGETAAVDPVVAEVTRRGLLFFDNGASSSSVVGTSARHLGTHFAVGTSTLDSVQTQAAIDKKLVDLETQARQDGFAIGVGSPYPITVARIADWAASVESRGFALAPISALAARPGDGAH